MHESIAGAVAGPLSEQESDQTSGAVTLAAIGTVFEGFGFDDNATENGGYLFIPPDPMGAAGTDRLVAVVNTMIEARTKAGALLWRDALKDFLSPLAPANFTFDPKVIFDHYENRFVVVSLERVDSGTNPNAGNTSRILLAVSKTATPATATSADWRYAAINAKEVIGGVDHWADYPGFEVDEEAVYITASMFAHQGGVTIPSVRLWIVDKGVASGFYGGGAASATKHNPYAGGGIATTTMPALVYGTGGIGTGVGTYLVSYSGISGAGIESVQVIRVNNPLGAVTFTGVLVPVGDIDDTGAGMPDAPQFGSVTRIETNDRRALDAVWRNNYLWLTAQVVPGSGPDINQATAHWFRLDTSSWPPTLSDQGDIGGEDIAAGTHTFFPSVAVNHAGDAKFGFAASSSGIYAGAYVAGRLAGDAAGTVQATETVRAGVDYYKRTFGGTRNRWGDYSGISLDPTDDSVFWVFNEYAMTRGTRITGEDGRWGTTWASCSFPGTIQIVKDAVPDAAQDFGFTTTGGLNPATFDLDDDADGTLPNTQTFSNIAPGAYTVSETAVAGYSTALSCVDPDGGTTTTGSTANIDLDAGETVVCTFTNTNQPEYVDLASWSVTPGKGGVLLQWRTGAEISNLGFNIYRNRRDDAAAATQINGAMIPSKALGTIGGASYSFLDTMARSGVPYYYWLEDVSAVGRYAEVDGYTGTHALGAGKWVMPKNLTLMPLDSGRTQTQMVNFLATYKDADKDLAVVYLLIGDGPDMGTGLALRYDVGSGLLSAYDARAGAWRPGVEPRGRGAAATGAGSLRARGSWVAVLDDGNAVRVNYRVKFWKAMLGTHNVYMNSVDAAGNATGWELKGTWEVLP